MKYTELWHDRVTERLSDHDNSLKALNDEFERRFDKLVGRISDLEKWQSICTTPWMVHLTEEEAAKECKIRQEEYNEGYCDGYKNGLEIGSRAKTANPPTSLGGGEKPESFTGLGGDVDVAACRLGECKECGYKKLVCGDTN
jgi:hypothetical protein